MTSEPVPQDAARSAAGPIKVGQARESGSCNPLLGPCGWFRSQASATCSSCRAVKAAQVRFRAAQYWIEFKSLKMMRALTRAEARIGRACRPQEKMILTAAYEEDMLRALSTLTSNILFTVLSGIPGWVTLDGGQVQRLLCDIVGPMLPTSRLDVERIGSDGFNLESSTRIGPLLSPSHKGHLISLSLGGQSVRWAVLPLALGVGVSGAAGVAAVRSAMRCIHLPPPRRVRLYVPDQGELYCMAECHSGDCFFCHLGAPLMRSVFHNRVRSLCAQEPISLDDWPDLASAVSHFGINSVAQVVVAPLHWMSIVFTQFLKFKWNVVGDYVRGCVRGCGNLDLDGSAPPPIVPGVPHRQRTGIPIKSLTSALNDAALRNLLSAETLSAPRLLGEPAVAVSERDLFDAVKLLRFENLDADQCEQAMQTVVDVFFSVPLLASYWTRGCHAGLHVPTTLRRFGLTLGDILEQNIEHINQEFDVVSKQFGGDGVRASVATFRTARMLEEGWAVVAPRRAKMVVEAADPFDSSS